MRFAEPQWLMALWGLVPLTAVMGLAALLTRRDLGRLTRSPAVRAWMWQDVSGVKLLLSRLLLLAAYALVVLALARPQWGTRLETIIQRGVDVLIALDTSVSMDTPDVSPSRLEQAKSVSIALLRSLKDVRVGVIVFSGAASLHCPLTIDLDAAQALIETSDTALIAPEGTDIGAAIALARDLFHRRPRCPRAVVIISDGENLQGDCLAQARQAADEGMVLFTVGVGTPAGQPIPVRDANGAVTDYIRNENGEAVISRLDETTLATVARDGGGNYFRSSTTGREAAAIGERIAALDKSALSAGQVRRFEERFQIPLALAIVCLAVQGMLSSRKWSRWKRVVHPAAAVLILTMAASVLPRAAVWNDPVAEATRHGRELYDQKQYAAALAAFGQGRQTDPHNPILAFDIGDALLQLGKYEQALAEFDLAKRRGNPHLQARALFNMGNAYVAKGDLSQALACYRDSLQREPQQEDARRNFELALRELKQQQADQNFKPDQTRNDNHRSGGGTQGKGDKKPPASPRPDPTAQDRQGSQGQTKPSSVGKTGQAQPSGAKTPSAGEQGQTQPPGSKQASPKEQGQSQPQGVKMPGDKATPPSKESAETLPSESGKLMDRGMALRLLEALSQLEKQELRVLRQRQWKAKPAGVRRW